MHMHMHMRMHMALPCRYCMHGTAHDVAGNYMACTHMYIHAWPVGGQRSVTIGQSPITSHLNLLNLNLK